VTTEVLDESNIRLLPDEDELALVVDVVVDVVVVVDE
jgi:hypothetical protein